MEIHKKRSFSIFELISYTFVSVAFIISAVSLLFSLKSADAKITRSDILLSLAQCALGIFAINLPILLSTLYNIKFSPALTVLYFAFLYCSVYLGEVKRFYIDVPHWDDLLHFSSGIMLCSFIVTVLPFSKIFRSENSLSIVLLLTIAVSFSLTVGILWEIYEFAVDHFFDLNMQKYRLSTGEPLQGHSAVFDTMKDIIIDLLGALTSAIISFFSLKRKFIH